MSTFSPLTGNSNPLNGIDVGDGDSYSAPSLGDIDGDGDLDLVVGERSGVLNYYRNTGTATAPVYAKQTGTANPFNGIVVREYSLPDLADVDYDGDLDLIVGDVDGVLNYYSNTGTAAAPAFVAQTGTDNPFQMFRVDRQSPFSAVDLDGDGDLELVFGDVSGRLNYRLNTGDPHHRGIRRPNRYEQPFRQH